MTHRGRRFPRNCAPGESRSSSERSRRARRLTSTCILASPTAVCSGGSRIGRTRSTKGTSITACSCCTPRFRAGTRIRITSGTPQCTRLGTSSACITLSREGATTFGTSKPATQCSTPRRRRTSPTDRALSSPRRAPTRARSPVTATRLWRLTSEPTHIGISWIMPTTTV